MGSQLQEILNNESFQKNELQTMLNNMEDSVILLDSNLSIKEMNPSAELLFNSKLKDSRYKKLDVILQNNEINRMVKKSTKESESSKETIYYSNGNEQYLQVHSTPIFNANKQNQGVLLVLHNLTRMKQLENMRK